jgi:ariadne-1
MDAPEKTLQQAGVASTKDAKASVKTAKDVSDDFMCDICCDDDPDMKTIGVSCGHRFCTTCYTHYLAQKIREEGESRRIQCPQSNCPVIVDEETVKQLVDENTCAKYFELLNRTFVDDNDFLRWCPAPDCEYAIECSIPSTSLTSVVPTVECNCSCRFCFGCGLYDHQVKMIQVLLYFLFWFTHVLTLFFSRVFVYWSRNGYRNVRMIQKLQIGYQHIQKNVPNAVPLLKRMAVVII